MSKNTVYRIVCDRLIQEMDRGNIPWRKPWSAPLSPQNYVSKRPYQGVNHVLLSCEVARRGCPYFASLKQIRHLGGRVLDWEFKKSSIVTFWRWVEIKDDEEEDQAIPFLRYYRIWNLAQTEGIEWSPPKTQTIDPINECERIVEGYRGGPAIITDGGNRCYYSPINDSIHVPDRNQFSNGVAFYSSLFHEMIHSTGHKRRLNRQLSHDHESTSYAVEELIAETGSAFLLGVAGIEEPANLENNAAYLRSWMQFIADHPQRVVSAFSKAQKAADWVLGNRDSKKKKREEVYHVAA